MRQKTFSVSMFEYFGYHEHAQCKPRTAKHQDLSLCSHLVHVLDRQQPARSVEPDCWDAPNAKSTPPFDLLVDAQTRGKLEQHVEVLFRLEGVDKFGMPGRLADGQHHVLLVEDPLAVDVVLATDDDLEGKLGASAFDTSLGLPNHTLHPSLGVSVVEGGVDYEVPGESNADKR